MNEFIKKLKPKNQLHYKRLTYILFVFSLLFMLAVICSLIPIVTANQRTKNDLKQFNELKANHVFINLNEKEETPLQPDNSITLDEIMVEIPEVTLVPTDTPAPSTNLGGLIHINNTKSIPFYTSLSNLKYGACIYGDNQLGRAGRTTIIGHRDQSFNYIKNIEVGDTVSIESLSEKLSYTVTNIKVVEPDQVPVHQTEQPTLTLVTCYPFRYIGSSPQRYVVEAVLNS